MTLEEAIIKSTLTGRDKRKALKYVRGVGVATGRTKIDAAFTWIRASYGVRFWWRVHGKTRELMDRM